MNKQYPLEFREEALKMLNEQQYSYKEVAENLNVTVELLYQWRANAKKKEKKPTLPVDEHKELITLRKEVKRLKMEAEILKKASAFFAKQMK